VVLAVVFVVVFVDDNLHVELIATNTLVYWFVLYLLLVPKKKKKMEKWALDSDNMFWFFRGEPACWLAQRDAVIFSW
jgi:hypothetical protein